MQLRAASDAVKQCELQSLQHAAAVAVNGVQFYPHPLAKAGVIKPAAKCASRCKGHGRQSQVAPVLVRDSLWSWAAAKCMIDFLD